ncbi:DnaB-like helicase C-terminal domain-containing protein [Aureliella helgolandensis]|uniref:Replicative DNA helicase n=1 Tax=Aureliella helgolandensis TaxID=2527968 RepID=A0A518GBI2_9BACT|nr:DnaB-like helicase C-terminal domain-containing protein [Aureliella helgolandensis]QDV25955.1 Replicative DNA helicase [Aureliella helgolandensis]
MTKNANVLSSEYLHALYGNCSRGQVVFVKPCRNQVSAVFNIDQLDLAARHVELEPTDLFIKVNPIDYDRVKQRNLHGIGSEKEVEAVVSLHFDIDAGKPGYATQQDMLAALDTMPLSPSAIIQSDGDDGGYHVYWLLDEPHYIFDDENRMRCAAISGRWLEELRICAKGAKVDSTANLDRLLRPVGSIRKSGNTVAPLFINSDRRYKLQEFELPGLEKHLTPTIQRQQLSRFNVGCPSGFLDARAQGYIQAADKPHEGGRNSCAFRLAGNLASIVGDDGERLSESDILGYVLVWNALLPVPLDEMEVQQCVQNGLYRGKPREDKFARKREILTVDTDNLTAPTGETEAAKTYETTAGAPETVAGQTEVATTTDSTSATETTTGGLQLQLPPVTTSAIKLLDGYMDDIHSGTLPQLIRQRDALDGIEVGFGLLTVLGGPPGTGKTVIASQVAFDAIELNADLQVIIANAEMHFSALLRREFTRRTRIKSDDLRFGRLTQYERERIDEVASDIRATLLRVQVVEECNLFNLARLAGEKPSLIIVDYLQKFAPSGKDLRIGVGEVAATLRRLCLRGHAVLALSATKRDSKGSHNATELSLSSFKESGEVEYNADSAYVLRDEGALGEEWRRRVTLACVKNRHGAQKDFKLEFDRPRMEFLARTPQPLAEFGNLTEVDSDDSVEDFFL